MNEFDQFMKRELKIKYYIRYADDFVILSHDKEHLLNLLPRIMRFLKSSLRLKLHDRKVSISTLASGIDFLGWVQFPHHRILRTSTKQRMLKRIKENPREETIASYLGMIKHGNSFSLKREVERSLRDSDEFIF